MTYEEPTIRLLGRTWPRASGHERLAWAIVFVGVVSIFCLASQLTPNPHGMGTHQQIRLLGGYMPECGFVVWTRVVWGTGYPCPSCGFTTTFAHAMHGHLLAAIVNQPFGFLVFLTFAAFVPVSLACTIGQISPLRATDHWRWRWILGTLALLWLLGWIYKIRMTTG
jgi:hypothetical protein